jgi:hypothetical protein
MSRDFSGEQKGMKKSLLAIGLFVSAVCAAGCVVVVNEETREPRERTRLPADQSIAEIDAVSKLAFESDRKQGYKRIAQRQGLSAKAQVHLVETALGKLAFDSGKEEVLLTLIENPGFCHAAEQAILEDLNRLAFESSKKKILEAISRRKA